MGMTKEREATDELAVPLQVSNPVTCGGYMTTGDSDCNRLCLDLTSAALIINCATQISSKGAPARWRMLRPIRYEKASTAPRATV